MPSLKLSRMCVSRNKCGIWGWRQDKSEVVNGYECKVFGANNVELVSKTRTEHLPRGERRAHTPRAPLAGLLALADSDDAPSNHSLPSTPVEPLLTPDRVRNDLMSFSLLIKIADVSPTCRNRPIPRSEILRAELSNLSI